MNEWNYIIVASNGELHAFTLCLQNEVHSIKKVYKFLFWD